MQATPTSSLVWLKLFYQKLCCNNHRVELGYPSKFVLPYLLLILLLPLSLPPPSPSLSLLLHILLPLLTLSLLPPPLLPPPLLPLQTQRLVHLFENTNDREVASLADVRAAWPQDVGFDLFVIATVCLRKKAKERPHMDQVRTCVM